MKFVILAPTNSLVLQLQMKKVNKNTLSLTIHGAHRRIVLQYLETMSNDRPDDTPPRSIVDPNEYRYGDRSEVRTPPLLSPRSKKSDILLQPDYQKQNGSIIHGDDLINGEDADSNVQEGMRSELGEPLPIVRFYSTSIPTLPYTLQ